MQETFEPDFSLSVWSWSTSRRRYASQITALNQLVKQSYPDVLVVINIPRHHAKKLGQADWAKDYYVSKENRQFTTDRTPIGATGSPTAITVVFSRYPASSEEFFARESGEEQAAAHVMEVCIPLNAWRPDRSPLPLLQEYQVVYDDVSTITFVVSNHEVDDLRTAFHPDNVQNSVIFITPQVENPTATNINCGLHSDQVAVEAQLQWWDVVQEGSVMGFASTLGDDGADA